jgi:alpha-galactosidase
MLSNTDVIAIDQDPLGIQGTAVKRDHQAEVWVKPLAAGWYAIALLNRGRSAQQIVATPSELGLPSSRAVTVCDLSDEANPAHESDAIAKNVPAHGAALYRIKPATSA